MRSMNYLHVAWPEVSSQLKSSVLMSPSSDVEALKPDQDMPSDPLSKKYSGIENGLKVFKLNKRHLLAEICLTLLIGLNFILQIVSFERDVHQEDPHGLILWALLSSYLGIIACSWCRFQIRQQLARERKQARADYYTLIMELLIYSIQPFPFFDQTTITRFSIAGDHLKPIKINHLLIILSIPKLLFLARGLLLLFTKYSDPRSHRVCKFYTIENNYLFHLRCIFRDHPAQLIAILYASSLLVFAYCFRISEIGVDQQSKLNYFGNAVWLAILTMNSIGYGDVHPVTQIGSLLTIAASLIGVIATSLFVLSIKLNLEPNFKQERSLLILKRIEMKKIIKNKSAMLLRLCLWRKWKQHKIGIRLPTPLEERMLMRQLRILRQKCKGMSHQSMKFEQVMVQQFQHANILLVQLSENANDLMKQVADRRVNRGGMADRMFSRNIGKSLFASKIIEVTERILKLGEDERYEQMQDWSFFMNKHKIRKRISNYF